MDGTSKRGNCKEPGGTEGVLFYWAIRAKHMCMLIICGIYLPFVLTTKLVNLSFPNSYKTN